jgi:hypothetical protein
MLKNSTFAFAFSPPFLPPLAPLVTLVVVLSVELLDSQHDSFNLLATSRATEYKLWRHDPPQLAESYNQSPSPCVITQGALNEN